LASESQEKPASRPTATFRQWVDAVCEKGILALVLAILAWGPLAYGAVLVNPDSLEAPHLYGLLTIQGLTALAAALWIVRFFTQHPFRLLWPPICWAVLAFVVYAIVRCQTAELPYIARQNLRCVILYGTLFFVIVNNLNRRESAKLVVLVLIAVAAGESLFAFYQFMTHAARVWALFKPVGYVSRGSGTYINPNNFAGFVEMVLPLALAYTAMGRLSVTKKVVLGYCALVMMAGIVVSQSRGGLTAMGVTLAVFCVALLFQRDYWRRGALALGVLIVAGLVLMQQFGKVEQRFGGGLVDEGDGRVFYWRVAEDVFHEHLLWGAGPGSFRYLYPMSSSPWQQTNPLNAHNDYLTTLCEWGLAGFSIIIVTLGLALAGVSRIWPFLKRSSADLGRKNSSRAAFVLGASLGLLSMTIHSVVDFNMQIPSNAVTAIALLALLSAYWRFATERFWLNPRMVGRILLVAAVGGAVFFLGREGLQAGQEFYWLERGLRATSWSAQVAALENAQKIEPANFMTDYELGEACRLEAWKGEAKSDDQAREGAQWFQRGMALNPYDYETRLGYGKCLDWLDRPKEATKFFVQALMLNPNNARVEWEFAWHCSILKNYPLAEHWLERSLSVVRTREAEEYLDMVKRKIAEESQPAPPGR
jgi:O-antigen ligase